METHILTAHSLYFWFYILYHYISRKCKKTKTVWLNLQILKKEQILQLKLILFIETEDMVIILYHQ